MLVSFVLEDGINSEAETGASVHEYSAPAAPPEMSDRMSSKPLKGSEIFTISTDVSYADVQYNRDFEPMEEPLTAQRTRTSDAANHISILIDETPMQLDLQALQNYHTPQWDPISLSPNLPLSSETSPADSRSTLSVTSVSQRSVHEEYPHVKLSQREASLIHHYVQNMAPWV